MGHIVQLPNKRKGEVRFVGETLFAEGIWVGVELEDASGKNDGSVYNERYFTCEENRGMFIKLGAVKVIGQAPPRAAPAPKPSAVRRASRPTSLHNPSQTSTVTDAALKRRISLNAPSPSPGPRPARPSTIARV